MLKIIKRAGIKLSAHGVPGLSGSLLSHEKAMETVHLLEQRATGGFDRIGEVKVLQELLLMLILLDGVVSTIDYGNSNVMFLDAWVSCPRSGT